ncbi:MAG: GlsB/YeaQ/YmgE family stress response membrane protein [Blastocatellales bacterium]
MSLLSFVILLLIAGICGAIGQAIAGSGRGGILVSIAIGFIGALIGMWVAGEMGLRELFALNIGGQTFPIVWSIFGSALFVAVISLITRRRHRWV